MKNNYVKLSAPQLKEYVQATKRNAPKEFLEPQEDGTYKLINWTCMSCPPENFIEVPDEAELYVYWPHDKGYHFQSGQGFYEDGGWNLCSFSVEEIKKGEAGAEILWSREPIQDPALISGAEALRALADGKEVELLDEELDIPWTKIMTEKDERNAIEPCISMFFDGYREIKFRLKPQTIKLELELPKPFEPKEGDECYFLNDEGIKGYSYVSSLQKDNWDFNFGAWRTEDEIKQVVEQLRKIRGTNS